MIRLDRIWSSELREELLSSILEEFFFLADFVLLLAVFFEALLGFGFLELLRRDVFLSTDKLISKESESFFFAPEDERFFFLEVCFEIFPERPFLRGEP